MYKNNQKNLDVFGFAWREMEKGARETEDQGAGRGGGPEKVCVIFEFPFRAHFGRRLH